MKIISKFYDYYDKTNMYGVDDIYYMRLISNTQVETEQRTYSNDLMNEYRYGRNVGKIEGYYLHLIGFCGDIYPMVEIRYKSSSYKSKYVYDSESLVSELERCEFRISIKSHRYKALCDKFFDNRRYDNYKKLFQEFKSPIFHAKLFECGGAVVEFNSRLSEFQFQAVIDPFTAHQRISSYLSGVLGRNENEIVQISDTSMRDKKGFDKFSFKKQKTKNRGKKIK